MPFSPMDEVELQQSLAGLARFVRHYYVSLVAEGFTPDQALHLSAAWQTVTMAQVQEQQREDED